MLGLVLATAGCAQHVYSPPARALPIEAPAPMAAGRTAVGGGGGGVRAIPFGPDLAGGSLRARRGVTEELEVSGEVSAAAVLDESRAEVFPVGLLARSGVKWAPPALGRHLALTSGVGAGAHAAGGLVAFDGGLVVGYDNRYFVPRLGFAGFVSVPVAERSVDVSEPDDPGPVLSRPRTSFGFQLDLGFQLPFAGHGAFSFGGAWVLVSDDVEHEIFLGATGALEVFF